MKRIFIILILLLPSLIFSQQETKEKSSSTKFPVHAVRSDMIKLESLSFNKVVPDYRGEILEVEFILNNMTDNPLNLYIFVIASYEKSFRTTSSFQSPYLEDKDPIKLFVPFPNDIKNFQYSLKDESGKEKIELIKYPKNIKSGTNPDTGKAYNLDNRMIFRSRHLTRYLKKYNLFNEVAVLIFDENEKLLFRQLYTVRPVKR